MPVFVTDEVVTAAKMNQIFKPVSAGAPTGSRTFTNTSFLDLDALTGGAGSVSAVIATVTTSTTCIVIIGTQNISNTAGAVLLTYRVSGATTVAGSDTNTMRNGATTVLGASKVFYVSGLNAGSNTFEVQARASAGTGTIDGITLTVIPI